MRRVLFLGLLLAAACSSPANLPSGATADVKCVDTKKGCDSDALRACPRGYTILKDNPPVGFGDYYSDHSSSTTAKQEMAYSMTVQCK